jgi:NDP-4-keto-2,6-dideoxyhexose 3-C-methyltransferase|tara:strand:- start:1647 stop:2900 length:1254 start_codon:yes stop_codon:yes gene_type:complete
MMLYREIRSCRICENQDLDSILELGNMALTGVFPKTAEEEVPAGPLTLVKCRESANGDFCGLVQLRETYNPDMMYGQNYGYRSGLNKSMVDHLHNKVKRILGQITLDEDDIVVDIGSNDSTLLQGYPEGKGSLVGFDPTGEKFGKYYPDHITLFVDFFNAKTFKDKFGDRKARVITSIAMFYDLDEPLEFVREVYDILSDDGIWVFEQSYMPFMLEANSFDTICHEHQEYYRLKEIHWMMKKVGFKIVDIEFNQVNGGSFSITVAKPDSSLQETPDLAKLLAEEENKGLSASKPYDEFRTRIYEFKSDLRRLLDKIRNEKGLILGYGASTKGNVLLQFVGITPKDIPYMGEVNADKFGSFTPGTLIPIISEDEARSMNPDYFFVFPWHFRDFILKKEQANADKSYSLLFPLPSIEII